MHLLLDYLGPRVSSVVIISAEGAGADTTALKSLSFRIVAGFSPGTFGKYSGLIL
jgi:hypothetical protein